MYSLLDTLFMSQESVEKETVHEVATESSDEERLEKTS